MYFTAQHLLGKAILLQDIVVYHPGEAGFFVIDKEVVELGVPGLMIPQKGLLFLFARLQTNAGGCSDWRPSSLRRKKGRGNGAIMHKRYPCRNAHIILSTMY